MGNNISKISPLVQEETSQISSKKAVVDASGSPQGKGLSTSASLLDFSFDNEALEPGDGKQKAELDAPIKPVEKRQHPGKLDITAAQDASKKDMQSVDYQSDLNKLETPDKTDNPSVLGHGAISRPGTPSTAVSRSGSPAPRAVQPRTIRMLQTPKLESPRVLSPAVLAVSSSPAVDKQPSRRGTPVSEMISDNVSITSISLSRANSPPPNKVGSAPVRQTTKSQQKKERQARAKLVEKGTKSEEAPVKEVEEEPVHAPIMGRKKKAKKAATEGTATSTPMASRPPSPPAEEKGSQEAIPPPATPVMEATKEVKESKKGSKKEATKAQKEKQQARNSPSPPAPSNSDPHEKNTPTAAAIIADLQKSGEILLSALDVFKNVTGLNQRFDIQPNELSDQHNFPSLTEPQRLQLDQGEAVRIEDTVSGRPIIVLPDKQVLRGLTPDQATRYLELRARTLSTTGPSSFMPSRATQHTAPLPVDAVALAQRSLEDASSELVNRFAGPLDSAAMSYWTSAGLPGVADAMREGRVADMSVEEAEQAMLVARRETEALEKRLNGLMKKNRKLVFGNGH